MISFKVFLTLLLLTMPAFFAAAIRYDENRGETPPEWVVRALAAMVAVTAGTGLGSALLAIWTVF